MKTEAQLVRIRRDALQTQVDRLTPERSGQFRLNPTHSKYSFNHFYRRTHLRLSAFRVSQSCFRRGEWPPRRNRKPFRFNIRRAPSCLIVQGGRSWTPPPERRSLTRHVEGTVEKRTRTGDRRSAAQTFGAVSRRARASRAHVDTVLDLGLPRPATKERGEGRGEGFRMEFNGFKSTSSPRPSPPFYGGEGVAPQFQGQCQDAEHAGALTPDLHAVPCGGNIIN
jgi:hypothetical protein